jgi:hypothetical protein
MQVPHISEDILELYALNRLPDALLPPVEEHVLICEECRQRLHTVDVFVSTLKTTLRRSEPNVVFWQLHQTDDGPVEIWIERAGERKWVSQRRGFALSGGGEFRTQAEAMQEMSQSFIGLFPEHICSVACLLGASGIAHPRTASGSGGHAPL